MFAVRARLNTEASGNYSWVVTAAMACPDEQRRLSLLPRRFEVLGEDPDVLCLLGPPASLFVTKTGILYSRGRLVVDSFCTSVATRFEQVEYTSSITRVSNKPASRSTKGLRLRSGGFGTAPGKHLEKLTERIAD